MKSFKLQSISMTAKKIFKVLAAAYRQHTAEGNQLTVIELVAGENGIDQELRAKWEKSYKVEGICTGSLV